MNGGQKLESKYKSELKKEEYINNFNWLPNWFERHFVGKVTDTLFGIFTLV